MNETEYFRQACKDQVKFTEKLCMEKDHEIALLELEIEELKANLKQSEKFIDELHEQNPSMDYFPPDLTLEDIEASIQASKEEGEY